MKEHMQDLRMDDFEESLETTEKQQETDGQFEDILDLADHQSAEEFSTAYDEEIQATLKSKRERISPEKLPSSNDLYYREAKKIPQLTAEQEKELAIRARAGDLEAKNKLVEANLMLVGFIAKRYMNHNEGDKDIIQEGNLGLMMAVERFDPNRGYKFSTYAVWQIRKSITMYLAEQGHPLSIPEKNHASITRIKKAIEEFKQMHNGREPKIGELSRMTGKSPETLQDIMRALIRPLSLQDTTREKKDGITLQEVIPDADEPSPILLAERTELYETVQQAMKLLNTKERRVIELRFGMVDGIPRTMEDIAREFGVRRQRIGQIELSAKKKLLASEYGGTLHDYQNV